VQAVRTWRKEKRCSVSLGYCVAAGGKEEGREREELVNKESSRVGLDRRELTSVHSLESRDLGL